MFKRCFVLLLTAVISTSAVAETRQLKLLNPDRSPAVDAKAVAILSTPGARVNEEFEPFPFHTMDGQRHASPVKAAENNEGVISFDKSAKAVIARNDHGFVFIPAEAFREAATLRPWANVKFDPPAELKEHAEEFKLRVLWSNCYACPNEGIRILSSRQKPDWRFQPLVYIEQHIDLAGPSTVRVPPGEIQLMLFDSEQAKRIEDDEVDPAQITSHVSFGIYRTRSGEVTDLSSQLPKFGGLMGKIKTVQSGLPDWSIDSENQDLQRVMTVRLLHNKQLPPAVLPSNPFGQSGPSTVLDNYAKFCATDEGLAHRRQGAVFASTEITADGSFQFDLLPVGEYSLEQMLRTRSKSSLAFVQSSSVINGHDDAGPVRATVAAGEHTDVGTVTTKPTPPVTNAFSANSPVKRQRTVWEAQTVVKDGQEVVVHLPRVITEYVATEPSGNDRSYQNQIPGTITPRSLPDVSDDSFRRDSLLPPHQPRPQTDSPGPGVLPVVPGQSQYPGSVNPDQAIIDRLLKLTGPDADRDEIEELLREHLTEEFEAKQNSRKAEIDRLQKLLEKSKELIGRRYDNRNEIIGRRLAELLKRLDRTNDPPNADPVNPNF